MIRSSASELVSWRPTLHIRSREVMRSIVPNENGEAVTSPRQRHPLQSSTDQALANSMMIAAMYFAPAVKWSILMFSSGACVIDVT